MFQKLNQFKLLNTNQNNLSMNNVANYRFEALSLDPQEVVKPR